MKRRDALARVALLVGGTLSAPTMAAFLEGCTTADQSGGKAFTAFSNDQLKLVAEIAEVIIPATDTPGAKEAQVAEFIQLMLKDCYYPKDQNSFLKGLQELSDKDFMSASPEVRIEWLTAAEDSAYAAADQTAQRRKAALDAGRTFDEPGVPFFRLMKELTLLGYFTSEAGATQALDYMPVPGSFNGCIPLEAGQKTWAI